jgi:hypothetical protein
LLLGAGGLRISEALNMFSTDVYLQETTQQALIALANPLEGAVKLPHCQRRFETHQERAV